MALWFVLGAGSASAAAQWQEQKENLQSQITMLQSQVSLLESDKRCAEDQSRTLEAQVQLLKDSATKYRYTSFLSSSNDIKVAVP